MLNLRVVELGERKSVEHRKFTGARKFKTSVDKNKMPVHLKSLQFIIPNPPPPTLNTLIQ